MAPPYQSEEQSGNGARSEGKVTQDTGDPILARVKEVARTIVMRVRETLGDTELDRLGMPSDATDEVTLI